MGSSYNLLKFCTLVVVLKYYVTAQEKYDESYYDKNGHLNEIPTTFELRGDKAKYDFKKFATDIETLTLGKNVTVVYKVRVDLQKPVKKRNKDKKMFKKVRSKKYNVPLKKQNMKLSNFEVLLRKLAEEHGTKTQLQHYEILHYSTDKPDITTTRQVKMKFKPIIHQVKTNYTKRVKPVRNKIITITL